MAYKTIDGITSSIVPFFVENQTVFVLLAQRGTASRAFANVWALVGGFLEPHIETLEQCAARELKEETGLQVAPASMKLVTIQSDPNRDPRGQIIDTVWSCKLPAKLPAVAADDVQACAWHSLDQALSMDLAFDHKDSLRQFAELEGFLPSPLTGKGR